MQRGSARLRGAVEACKAIKGRGKFILQGMGNPHVPRRRRCHGRSRCETGGDASVSEDPEWQEERDFESNFGVVVCTGTGVGGEDPARNVRCTRRGPSPTNDSTFLYQFLDCLHQRNPYSYSVSVFYLLL
jgi:hypothetical protein